MPTTKSRQTTGRQTQTRRRTDPSRLDALRRPPVPPRNKRGRGAKQQTGLMATLTSAIGGSSSGSAKRGGSGAAKRGGAGAAKRGGKPGVLAALGAAGAVAAFAKRRNKQRGATTTDAPESTPSVTV